jgi:hypothetical protein
VMVSYDGFYNSVRCSGDSNSHLGASKVIAGVNRSRRWPQPHRFWRVSAEGNGKNPLIETFLLRFNPPGDPRHWSGAPGLDREASVDLKRRRRSLTGARVLVGDERIHGEEELGFLELIHSGGSDYIDDGGRRPSSCALNRRRWIGCLAELHQAASTPRLKMIEMVSWLGCGAGCWAGLVFGQMGCGQVSASLYFFLLIHFFLLLVFCFEF